MKKIQWIALLALALTALLPCAALAAAGDANIARNEAMYEKYDDGAYGACVCGDTLYFYGNRHIYTYHIGDADLTALDLELPETAENQYRNVQRLFSDGERIYLMCTLERYGDDGYGLVGAELYPVEIDGEQVTLGEPLALNTDKLTSTYGGDEAYFIQINDVCYVGGYLMMYVYDDNGNEAIYALDIETGEGSYIEDLERVRCITAYADDQLLIGAYDYNTGTFEFQLYDPQAESLTAACPPIEADSRMSGLVYSAESERLFFMSGGYVKAVTDFDFENAEEVAELSSIYYGENGGMLLPGD